MTDADRKLVEKRRPVAAGTCLAGAQGPGKGTRALVCWPRGTQVADSKPCFRTCEANYFVNPLKSEIHTEVFVESVTTSQKHSTSLVQTNRLILLTTRVLSNLQTVLRRGAQH